MQAHNGLNIFKCSSSEVDLCHENSHRISTTMLNTSSHFNYSFARTLVIFLIN